MERLFSNKDLSDVLRQVEQTSQILVDNLPKEQFLHSSDEEILQHVLSKCEIVPIEIYEDKKIAEEHETKVEINDYGRRRFVNGLQISVTIPYFGTQELWKLRPSNWTSVFPFGIITSNERVGVGNLEIIIQKPSSATGDQFKSALEKSIENIRFYLDGQRKDIEVFNDRLPQKINIAIRRRRENLQKHDSIIEALDIPLKRREGVPDITQIPIKRKLVKPLPPAPKKPLEYGIRDEDYEHILNVIHHAGATFEATPETYKGLGEEDLRNIILANLNGHYQGDATGETFRKGGKTDIRIEFEGRAAFIAECKIWHGEKKVSEAIDQLLEYLIWRDCKTCLILFNKDTAGFSSIQKKVPSFFKNHGNYVHNLQPKNTEQWRYILKSKDDEDRHVVIHIFLFNLYVSKKV